MAFVTDAEINDIRAKANIVDIIGGYIPLTQRGKNYLCVCPFHDDHSPSMSVSAEKQIYKCFSCGETGNVFTFVSKYEGVSFIEAVAIVAAKCGLKLSETTFNNNFTDVNKTEHEIMDLAEKFFQNNLKTSFGETAMAYLKDRGINNDIIKDTATIASFALSLNTFFKNLSIASSSSSSSKKNDEEKFKLFIPLTIVSINIKAPLKKGILSIFLSFTQLLIFSFFTSISPSDFLTAIAL